MNVVSLTPYWFSRVNDFNTPRINVLQARATVRCLQHGIHPEIVPIILPRRITQPTL